MLPERIGEAAKSGDIETIRAYFEDDSDGERDVDDVCDLRWTPLMWCAWGDNGDRLTLGNVEVAHYLLSRGASIDIKDGSGHTALLIACYSTPTTRRTRGAQKWTAAVAFLARQGDNGVVWNVLSFWRATE